MALFVKGQPRPPGAGRKKGTPNRATVRRRLEEAEEATKKLEAVQSTEMPVDYMLRVAGALGQLEPEHVHRRAELLRHQRGALAHRGVAPVASHHKRGAHRERPAGCRAGLKAPCLARLIRRIEFVEGQA